MRLSDFDYPLDKSLIAFQPLSQRDQARMLVCDHSIVDAKFTSLLDYLTPKDLVIFNNTKVIPAKLNITVLDKEVSIYLNEQIDQQHWYVFAKPSKRLVVGETYAVATDFNFRVVEKHCSNNRIKVELEYQGDLIKLLDEYGFAPLPPYIEKKHKSTTQDKTSYQSIFAQHLGSVAAPTASLHFTEIMLEKMRQKNISYDFVTLHVGNGTFLPMTSTDINDHLMHGEYCNLSQDTAERIMRTKNNGGRILAVGSTAMRTLENAATGYNNIKSFSGINNIFIKPGYDFKVVDILLTNFHLPKSTLLVLVSAFIGHDNMLKLYQHAIKERYRFFSYGDCCLLSRNGNLDL